ncbi:TPA: hypothetical protein ACT9A3_000097 [Legionella pneumophila]|nr:hypothetical protein [Legionella pneumophila]HDO7947815.1 hypothetical protein [Legionella pneumophila]HDO7951317.1 hypothetical protein [Legionella pneumophila]HDO8178524.1 hypothetical protein [Legionella pneumophila]HDO8338110.1 hypothetical protein [Legionella pneumophila]
MLVERFISKDETRQSRKARRRGQINRYKANDLVKVQRFFWWFSPFVYRVNKVDKARSSTPDPWSL